MIRQGSMDTAAFPSAAAKPFINRTIERRQQLGPTHSNQQPAATTRVLLFNNNIKNNFNKYT
jgi:hypothetical protein